MADNETKPSAPSFLQRYWFGVPLWVRIVPALVLGAAVGLIFGPDAQAVKWIGDIFVRLTRMLVVPLVFLTICAGVIALGDPKRLGVIGFRVIGMFALTAGIAALIGLILGIVFRPGIGVDMMGAAPEVIRSSKTLSEQLLSIIPINPVQAMVEGDVLAIIFFASLFATGILALGARGQPLAETISIASDVMMKLVRFVIETAPFGVFGLVAAAVGTSGAGIFVNISILAGCVLGGCVVLTLIVQPLLIRLLARLPATTFLRKSIDAMLVAFSTSSSSASLPVELSIAERKLGIAPAIRSTVMPVGVSIGRDGTALYVALLCIFASQALGIDITAFDMVLVVLVSALIALSAPPVPSAALFMMAAVLSVIGIDDARSAIIVGFILPFDRLLDMMRTVPNVLSNLTNTTIIARSVGEIDETAFRDNNRR